MVLLKVLAGIIVVETVLCGLAFVLLLTGISISRKEEEERIKHESNRLSEED